MHTITNIHAEINRLSERRVGLWNGLAHGRDPARLDEIKQIDAELAALWAARRAERARIRFGEPGDIVRRARLDERLHRAA